MRRILVDWGAACKGCKEKKEFVQRILKLQEGKGKDKSKGKSKGKEKGRGVGKGKKGGRGPEWESA